jgi:hypothetical protein
MFVQILTLLMWSTSLGRSHAIYDGHHCVWNLWHSQCVDPGDAPRESHLSAPIQVLITDNAPCQSALGSWFRL